MKLVKVYYAWGQYQSDHQWMVTSASNVGLEVRAKLSNLGITPEWMVIKDF